MSSSEYILRIKIDEEKYKSISKLLGVIPTSVKSYWEYSINDQSILYTKAIDYLTDLLGTYMLDLKSLGVTHENISLWYLYEFDEQCNMEFAPGDLKKLGDLGIVLCISCWNNTST